MSVNNPIRDWEVKTSGDSMTITGQQFHGTKSQDVKIAGIETIQIDKQGPYATAKGGDIFRLSPKDSD